MADDAPEEKKVEHLTLKVIGSDMSEVSFKIKKTTPLAKLMDAYIKKTGQDQNSVRFLFEGERIQGGQTPDDLSMEDGDQIQVTIMQLGGMC
ncbi:hypothetical protein CXG81DRAFT_25195 [Caulochytrium protostelioides]|uniref:Ubiquitin-like domain-containing protein n=1 Tax=Caulochytrium protostelioides TaxID=1555241 RepID=A0A4P9XAQ9_9FUNG|nr:hypothetical protein CXG81DRAFT_25195 [Caulochytrium protostelioides]|eukprot:RKP02181.1 hypothetical protein CXG81DRAFT_25195 [Caulochytrium protostelioides]